MISCYVLRITYYVYCGFCVISRLSFIKIVSARGKRAHSAQTQHNRAQARHSVMNGRIL